MGLAYHYSHPTTPAGAGFDIDLGEVVQLGQVGLMTYANMETAGSSVPIDDYAGALDLKGLHRLYVVSSDCRQGITLTGTVDKTAADATIAGTTTEFLTELVVGDWIVIPGGGGTEYLEVLSIASDTSLEVVTAPVNSAAGQTALRAGNSVVWNGYIGDQHVSRGGGGPEDTGLTGAERRWVLDLEDDNSILSWRTFQSDESPDRPAETVAERLAWLLAIDWVETLFVDHGLVDYPAIDMDANDYTNQRPKDVLANCALQCTGYTFWAQYFEPAGDIQLWFGSPNDSLLFTSPLAISNVAADIDSVTVFAASLDSTLHRSPQNIAAEVTVPYSGGAVTVNDLDTSYAFGYRSQIGPTASVKTSAQATVIANGLLAQHDSQEEWIETTVWLPPAQLNDIKAGHRLQARFSHLPGYETATWVRVMERTIASFEKTEGLYEVVLKLSPQTPVPFYGEATVVAFTATGDITDFTSVWASDDNSTWHEVIASGDWTGTGQFYALIPLAERNHRYWQVRLSWTSLGGYDSGNSFNTGELWAAPGATTYGGSSASGMPPISPPSSDGEFFIDDALRVIWVGHAGAWVGTSVGLWDSIGLTAVRLSGSLTPYGTGNSFGPYPSGGWGVSAGVVGVELESFSYTIELPEL